MEIKLNKLTSREKEVLTWICQGKTNWEIATILNISFYTVKNHVRSILQKLDACNRVIAANMVLTDRYKQNESAFS